MDYNSNGQYTYGNYPPPPPPPPTTQQTNGKAITSMVMGILSIVIPWIGFIFGIIGLILSTISLREVKKKQEQGRGFAIAGLVCSIISVAIYGLLIVIAIIVFVIALNDTSNMYNYYNYSNF